MKNKITTYSQTKEEYINNRYPIRPTISIEEVQRLAVLNIGRVLTDQEMEDIKDTSMDSELFVEVLQRTTNFIFEVTNTKCNGVVHL